MNEENINLNPNENIEDLNHTNEIIPNSNLEEEIKTHYKNKNEWRSYNGQQLGFLLFANYAFLIWYKEMQSEYIQQRVNYLIDKNPIINFNYDILYWVPNIITSLVFGFVCDYIGNENFVGGYKTILGLLHFPLLFGQIFIVLSLYNQNDSLTQIYFMFGKFLYSISVETLQSFVYGYITLWFKYNNQIEIICSFTFAGCCGCVFKEVLFVISYDNSDFTDNNSLISFFATYLGILIIITILILNLNLFIEDKVDLRDHQFYKNMKEKYKFSEIKSNNELDEKENIFPSSFCNTFHLKLLKIRVLLIAIVHGIIYSVNYMMITIPKDNILTKLERKFFNYNPDIRFIYIIGFNIVKAFLSVYLIPNYISKTGNRSLFLFISLILNIISLGYVYNFLNLYNDDNISHVIFKISLIIPAILFAFGSALQQIIFFTYIPLLVSEEYYMTAYGFLSCIQSIFVVTLSICNYKMMMQNYLNEIHEVSQYMILIMIFFLIVGLLLFILLEYYDRVNPIKPPKLSRTCFKETRFIKRLHNKNNL